VVDRFAVELQSTTECMFACVAFVIVQDVFIYGFPCHCSRRSTDCQAT